MFALLFALPCLATVVAMLVMFCTLPLVWARLERSYTPESTPDEVDAWVTDLEFDLAATQEMPCPVAGRLMDLGILPSPWVMSDALAAKLGMPSVSTDAAPWKGAWCN